MVHVGGTVVTLPTDDAASGLKRPLAVEIDIPPSSTIDKTSLNFEW
jgi:hypothetical protein